MQYLNTGIRINAPRSEVWDTLADFSGYGEWNPLLPRMQGALSPGSRIRLGIKMPFLPTVGVAATVQSVEHGRSFHWIGIVLSPKIFQGEHHFKLVSDSAGGTIFEQGEYYSGLFSFMAVLAMPMLRRGFERMNESLKLRVENRRPVTR